MNILDLRPGTRVRVKQTFHDFDGRALQAGTILELVGYDYFAHDGGHTFRFQDGAVVRLLDGDPRSEPVLADRASVFFERIDAGSSP